MQDIPFYVVNSKVIFALPSEPFLVSHGLVANTSPGAVCVVKPDKKVVQVVCHQRPKDLRTSNPGCFQPMQGFAKKQGGWEILRTNVKRVLATQEMVDKFLPGQRLVSHDQARGSLNRVE
jgi:hypothetical protein